MNPLTPGAIKLLTKLASLPLPPQLPPSEARWRQFATYLLDLHKSTGPEELRKLRMDIYWAINGPEHGACTATQAKECELRVFKWFEERNIVP